MIFLYGLQPLAMATATDCYAFNIMLIYNTQQYNTQHLESRSMNNLKIKLLSYCLSACLIWKSVG